MDAIEKQHKNWVGVYGPELGPRLSALHDRCGEDAVRKFLNGKLYGIPYGGLYVRGVRGQSDGEQVLSGLLDRLLNGEIVRVVSLTAYYSNNRRIPPGMQIIDGQLVDVLDPLMSPRSGKADDAVLPRAEPEGHSLTGADPRTNLGRPIPVFARILEQPAPDRTAEDVAPSGRFQWSKAMSERHDDLDQVLLGLVPSSVWNVATVTEEPQIRLTLWSIRQDQEGNRYFVGTLANDETGRVSTRIVEFNFKTKRGRTASGRVYELIGPPGRSADAEYVWSAYMRVNGIIETKTSS